MMTADQVHQTETFKFFAKRTKDAVAFSIVLALYLCKLLPEVETIFEVENKNTSIKIV